MNRISATVLSTLLAALATGAHAQPAAQGGTVPIEKAVPASVKTTQAPDSDPHYQVLDGTHFSYRCHVPYTLKTGEAAIEVCEIDPVKLQVRGWPETEVIHLIRGQVTVTEEGGASRSYQGGDIFVLPQGFKGIWEQRAPLLKVTVRHPLFWKD